MTRRAQQPHRRDPGTREDEVFMLIKGTALVWYDD
jgi:hypothetical protein